MKMEPQINADERRFAESYPHSYTVNTSNPVLLID
ncbi:hypothetical protein ig2599ANME_1488 [groundwater metagenome]